MPEPIKVFEHEYLFVGEKGFQHTHWKALGLFNARNKNKYFTLYPDGIKFNQYVGTIQAGNVTIEILPKADKEEKDKNKWRQVLLKMLRECRFIQVDHPELAHLQLQANSILDAYFLLFLHEVEKLLHSGLIKKYRRKEGNSMSLKGKLLFHRQLNINITHQERFYVQYSVYDREHIIHQILYTTLKLISRIAPSTVICGRANRLLLEFPEMKSVKHVNERTFKRIVLDRKSLVYTQSLLISKMLLLNYRPDITGGEQHILAMLFDMNKLWEEYVYRQLLKVNPAWNIARQNQFEFWEPGNNDPKHLRPDIIIENHKDGKVVIDTKWKLVDDEYPSDADLQQMFAYAHYVESHILFLLYPSRQKSKPKGSYKKEHPISETKKKKVHCSILKVPLRWVDGEFEGLDLEENDFKLWQEYLP